MLSGIGPAAELARHDLPCIADLPVGANLHDYLAVTIFWKLRDPEERGLALGSSQFNKSEYGYGNLTRWIIIFSLSKEILQSVAAIDYIDSGDPYLGARAHTEIIPFYGPIGASSFHPYIDGTLIGTGVLALLPTSRGVITLADTSPASLPIVDPQYLATEAGRASMRAGIRAVVKAMETPAGKSMVVSEQPAPGVEPLTSSASDTDLDARVQVNAGSFYQNAGTAAMGTVVDTTCKVRGIHGLRVCDASILPLPLGCHYQAAMYAIALAIADCILAEK